MVFMVFVAIAAALWCVMTLNEDANFDLRVPVKLTHIPDSVTVISGMPPYVQVSVRGKGTQLLRLMTGTPAPADIDFRQYRSANGLRLGATELKSVLRQSLGDVNTQILSPDSIIVLYTSAPPVILPVKLDCSASTAPGATLVKKPTLNIDSVKVYSSAPLSASITSISTEPLRFDDLNSTLVKRVKLKAPAGTRVIPDSVVLNIPVEPLITQHRTVNIETVGVPKGQNMITLPAKATVMYMVPMSVYSKSQTNFKVIADYADRSEEGTGRVRLRLRNVDAKLQNVRLLTDSVDYYISK